MADTALKEQPVWEEIIRQIETTDTVIGGEDGVPNIAPRQLANRTQYLKENKLDKTATAVSAKKLATARTITLSGDVTGSTSFDGSANKTITVTVKDDSHNHTASNISNLADFIMGFSPSNNAQNGWTQLPNGLIIQWGTYAALGQPNGTMQNFPVTFPNAVLSIMSSDTGAACYSTGVTASGTSQFLLYTKDHDGNDVVGTIFVWAVGY